MKHPYDISDFNEKGELKTPLGLVLVLLFLSRHLAFLLLAGLSEFMARGGGFEAAAFGLPPAWTLPLDIPLFAFLFLVLRKEKLSSGGLPRRILRHGMPILLTLAVLQLLLIVTLDYASLRHPSVLRMADTVLMVVCVAYLSGNAKIRGYFLRS